MNEQQKGPWVQVVAHMTNDNVCRFWSRHAWILFGLGLVHVAALVCCDVWDGFPRWLVYVFTVVLVTDAVLHARINRAYENEQLQRWHDLLALAASVDVKTKPATVKPSQPTTPTKPVPKPLPQLRVFQPDDEPARNGS